MTYLPPSPIQQPKKSNTGLIAGVIVGVVLLVCAGVVGVALAVGLWFTDRAQDTLDGAVAQASIAPAQPGSGGTGTGAAHTVRYEVDGTGERFIGYTNP